MNIQLVPCGRIEGQTKGQTDIMKPIVVFRNFANTSKNTHVIVDNENLTITRGFLDLPTLTFWRRIFFSNVSTPCILNVSNTETKQGSIMK